MSNPSGPLVVEIPLVDFSYSNEYVNIQPTNTKIVLQLTPGDNSYTTDYATVGSLTYFGPGYQELQAAIEIFYNYDPDEFTFTFYGNDLVSQYSAAIGSRPGPTPNDQVCIQPTYTIDAPCGDNQNWNYCTSATPGLKDLFQQSIRHVNQIVIDSAKAQGFTVIVMTPPPAVTAEESKNLQLLYDKDNGSFLGFYNEETDAKSEHIRVGLGSTWYGEIYLSTGEDFANVIGSSRDPKIGGLSWIQLWRKNFNLPGDVCSSLNFPASIHCSGTIYGGHCLLGNTAAPVAAGTSKVVFIMPICVQHNNDDSVYMNPITNKAGCLLANYLQSAVKPQNALEVHALRIKKFREKLSHLSCTHSLRLLKEGYGHHGLGGKQLGSQSSNHCDCHKGGHVSEEDSKESPK